MLRKDDVTMANVEGVSNVDGKAEKPRGEIRERLMRTMSSYGKELCFVVAILFTTYAALQNGPTRTQKASPPKRFFPWNSLVSDYYMGNIQHAFERISESDITFVMFYAPWDASSIETRVEFDKAARHMYRQIRFLAINCWWPDGECKKHFRRISMYPVLMAYPGTGRGIQYIGPNSMPHMVRFLENMIVPLKPVFSPLDLVSLRAKYDTVVLGYFDFEESLQPPSYSSFHTSALRALEKDVSNSVCFAVVSSKSVSAALMLKMASPSALLFRFNDTVIFPSEMPFKSDKLLKWVFENRQPIARWLSPPNSKSLLLSNVLETFGAALIMFTPYNPLRKSTPYFELLNEVAMDYYNCENSSEVQQLIDHSSTLRRLHRVEQRETESNCHILEHLSSESKPKWNNTSFVEGADISLPNSSCCHSVVVQTQPNFIQMKRRCDICVHESAQEDKFVKRSREKTCRLLDRMTSHEGYVNMIDDIFRSVVDVCQELMLECSPLDVIVACCRKILSLGNSSSVRQEVHNEYDGVDDRMEELLVEFNMQHCKRARAAARYSRMEFPDSSMSRESKKNKSFSGLGCRTNRTLTFFAMDTVQYDVFRRNLGVNMSTQHHQTTVLIYSSQLEVQHLLKQLVTQKSLVEFIRNYTDGHLSRHLRSSEVQNVVCRPEETCVEEITSNTFNDVVMNNEQDVVLMYYTPWCGFCKSAAHVFLSVARHFRSLKNLTFARINSEKDDLPWQFTAEAYPAIILYPAKRKAESRKFPMETPLTVPNLLRFILKNLNPKNRLQIVLSSCSEACISYNRRFLMFKMQTLRQDIRTLSIRLRHVTTIDHIDIEGKQKTTLFGYDKFLRMELQEVQAKYRHTRLLWLMLLSGVSSELSKSQEAAIMDNYNNFVMSSSRKRDTHRNTINQELTNDKENLVSTSQKS